jgi:alpha-beta hydrolase superfamily lysophospholipase
VTLKGILACAAVAVNAAAVSAQERYPLSAPPLPGAPKAQYQRLEVAGRDGTPLVVHEWAAARPAAGKPVVLFLHGIGMHGEPYASVEGGFTSRGLTFVVPDLRGHGRSGRKRGEMAEPHVLRADLGAVIGLLARRHRDTPVVLAGESMGGLLAADYAWRGERPLAGLVLLAPAFEVHPSQINLVDLGNALSGRVPLGMDERLRPSTRDEGFLKARKADRLALYEVPSSYLVVLAGLKAQWPRAAADLKLPLFVGVGGKDRVVDARAIKASYALAGTPEEDRTWRQWDAAYHTLCWDPLTPDIVEDMAKWVLKLSAK